MFGGWSFLGYHAQVSVSHIKRLAEVISLLAGRFTPK